MRARSLLVASFAFLVISTGLALESEARAGESEAGEAFKAGAAAYAKNDFRAAAAAFERAYRAAPRGAAIYNAGLAWEAAGESARAADAYTAALSGGDLGATQTSDARARVAAMEKTLGRVEVTAPAGATVSLGHVEGAAAPVTVHVSAGPHDATVRFSDGTTSKRAFTAVAGVSVPVAFEAPKASLAQDVPPPAAVAPPGESSSGPPGSRKLIGFAALGGGVIASGVAIALGVAALSAKSEFDDSGHHDQDAHDRAASLRTMTNVSWCVAGVLGVTGAVLVMTAPSGSSTSASAGLGPRGAFVSVRF
jgi:hypothetical protein